jgi:hypothetical protein
MTNSGLTVLSLPDFVLTIAQEYAVYKEGRQIESLTVSWMTPAELQDVIEGLLRGEYDAREFRPIQPLQTEPAGEHRCALCR